MRKLIGLLAIVLILFASCTPNPADENTGNDGDNEEFAVTTQNLGVDLTGATAIASYDFAEATASSSRVISTSATAKTVDISDVIGYLSGYTSDGLFSPMLFTTNDGTDILLGASKNCNNGKVEIIDTGSGTYLAIFDRLVVIDSLPILEPIRDALENILDIRLEINAISVSRKKNIAFINTETGDAYLLNSPYAITSANDLNFRLLNSTDDTYGYSDNRVYLLTTDNALYSFTKSNPRSMVAINNATHDPLKTNATIYTDDYAIYQFTEEDLGTDGTGYVEVYNARTPSEPRTINMTGSDDPLQNMIFRVGNKLFLRDRIVNNSTEEYGLTIYPLTVNTDLTLTIGEGVYYLVSTDFADNPDETPVKNSSVTIYGETESFLIRAENYLIDPALIWLTADANGRLSDINFVRLHHGSYFPYPIGDKAAITDDAMYWVANASAGTISMADFTTGNMRTITLNGGLASDDLSATESGNIIYHRYTGNGTDVGTYEYNPATDTEKVISFSTMDIHQIYEI